MLIRIAVDCMGGDVGPPVMVRACLKFCESVSNIKLLLYGNSVLIERELELYGSGYSKEAIDIIHTTQSIAMDESVLSAVRRKKNSSMTKAIMAVKEGLADTCVSSGNTGALSVLSYLLLNKMKGIDRPAMGTLLPCLHGGDSGAFMLDLGANVSCTSNQLFQFAIMGHCVMKAVYNVHKPRVGLLNLGHESIKGDTCLKETYNKLASSKLNFLGNLEGGDIFCNKADVIVCNGFVGNVIIKSNESLSKLLTEILREEYNNSAYSRIIGFLSKSIFRRTKERLDYRNYNGATFLGLNKVVVKSHGSADIYAVSCAIAKAYQSVNQKLVDNIVNNIEFADLSN